MRKNILITGISGNVGNAAYQYLVDQEVNIYAGVRSIEKYEGRYDRVELRKLDMTDRSTYKTALESMDSVFLVRPPALKDVDGIFVPFIQACVVNGIKHIVFLSLIGIEKNPFPPHHKIEKAIVSSGINYTFIRPSFFMQNLVDAHSDEIKYNNEIFIPSGKAKINFIDARDIGEICGRVMLSVDHYNKAYDVTGPEVLTYKDIARKMSVILGRPIIYSKPSMLKFRKAMINKGVEKKFVTVMMMLYLTTRLGMADTMSDDAVEILGRKGKSIDEFINDYIEVWL